MQIIFEKGGDKFDSVLCLRADGTRTSARLPKQGILPHDAAHYVVERAFELRHAFFGHIARGHEIDPLAQRIHDPGQMKTVEALQAESLVECFQALRWNGGAIDEAFMQVLQLTCAMRGVSLPRCTSISRLRSTYGALQEFNRAWRALPAGAQIAKHWHADVEWQAVTHATGER